VWRPTWLVIVAAVAAGCASPPGYQEARERLAGSVVGSIEPAPTAEPLPDDLSAYVKEAARYNAGLRRAFERWRAAVERVPQATALPDPMLSYGHFVESIETRVGPQRHRLTVQQRLPWFGTLDLRGRMALAAAGATERELEAEGLRVVYEVTRVYYDYAYLADAIRITRQNMNLLADIEAVARTLMQVGKAPQQHVIAAQVELGRLEDRLQTLTDRRRSVVTALNALMNRPAEGPLAWPDPKPSAVPLPDSATVVERFLTRNPSLLALEQRVAQADAAVELARKGYWPDVTLGITWIETGEGPLAFPDNGQDAILGMVAINLPIWRRKLRAGVRGALAARQAALAARREAENQLRARLEEALFRLRAADRQVRLYTDSLTPKAEQAYRTAQAGYAAGTVDFQGLVESQRLLLTFQLARERALADRVQRLAQVRMLAPEGESK